MFEVLIYFRAYWVRCASYAAAKLIQYTSQYRASGVPAM